MSSLDERFRINNIFLNGSMRQNSKNLRDDKVPFGRRVLNLIRSTMSYKVGLLF
jgi:hypothetical protein